MTSEQGHNPRETATATRRQMLRAAAGGFALAANGLFLPAWLEEAEAREGALGGAKGGRRGKDQRGRHKQRSHGDKKDKGKDKEAPGAFIRGIRWGVFSSTGTYDVEFWHVQSSHWTLKESRRITPDDFVEFKTDWTRGVLWINGRYFVCGYNGLGTPTVTLGYGGTFGKHYWEDGTTVIDARALREGEQAPPMLVDGIRFRAERLHDDDDFKRFSLGLT